MQQRYVLERFSDELAWVPHLQHMSPVLDMLYACRILTYLFFLLTMVIRPV